jgi:hypothetical protein
VNENVKKEVFSRVKYEDILFRAYDEVRRADAHREEYPGWFSNSVMAFWRALNPEHQGKGKDEYDTIINDVKQKIEEINERVELLKQIDAPDVEHYFRSSRIAAVELEGADRLYDLIKRILHEAGLLEKSRLITLEDLG